MKLGTQVGLGPGHIALRGDPAPLPQRGTTPPNFRSISVAAKWLHGSRCDMVWSLEVGLGPGDFVLDGDPAHLNFPPMLIIVIVISLGYCTGVRRYWFVQVQVQV